MSKYGNPFKIQMPEELKRELDAFAEGTGQTRSSVVREAIATWTHKKAAPKQAEVSDNS